MSARGFQAVWQPGSGGQWWRSGMSTDTFRAQSKEHFDDGFRLVSIAAHRTSDVPRRYAYTAVWRPGSGAQRWRMGMTTKQLESESLERFRAGQRISCIERRDDGQIWAVFHPGQGAQWWRSGMSWNQLRTEDTRRFGEGMRLVAIKRYRRQTNNRYLAVWRSGSGSQIARASMSRSELGRHAWDNWHDGLRVTWLDLVQGNYVAIWRPGSGTEWIHTGLDATDFRETDGHYFSQGLRLRSLRRVRIATPASSGSGREVVQLRRQGVHEGNRPFVARFPGLGQINGSLTGIRNESRSLQLAFVLPGNSTADCGSSGSVVTLRPGQHMTSQDLQSIYGRSRPELPVWLVACVAGGGSDLQFAPVRVDFVRR